MEHSLTTNVEAEIKDSIPLIESLPPKMTLNQLHPPPLLRTYMCFLEINLNVKFPLLGVLQQDFPPNFCTHSLFYPSQSQKGFHLFKIVTLSHDKYSVKPRRFRLFYVTFSHIIHPRVVRTFIIVIIYFDCKWVCTRWQWYYSKTPHTR
jgi:hypothetical protein